MDLFRSQFPTAGTSTAPQLPSIEQILLVGEAYTNPTRFAKSFVGRVTGRKKTELLKLAGLLKAQGFGRKATSAINMAYGKRRSYRAKRRYGARKPSRKRSNGRRRKVVKKNAGASTLSAIKKALSGSMNY